MTTLADLKNGETGVVASIKGDTAVKQRLTSMGFVKGTEVGLSHNTLFGDPRTYEVKGYEICMRNLEAEQIILSS